MQDEKFNEIITNLVADLVRLEEKITSLTERLGENTEFTKENLSQLQDLKSSVRVIEIKIQHLENNDISIKEESKSATDNKREWLREIVIVILSLALGGLASWILK